MDKQHPISYTFEDIKRYREGLMNREEMHAFEQASMEDPFLSDALEGYMSADMNTADQHLEAISQKIQNGSAEKEQAVVVPMAKRSYKMWRVAAMIIVIAGAGLITYNVLKKNPAGEPAGPVAVLPKETNPNTNNSNTPATIPAPNPENGNNKETPAASLKESPSAPSKDNASPASVAAIKQKEEAQKETAQKADIVIPRSENQAEQADVAVREVEKSRPAAAESVTRMNTNITSNQFRGRLVMPDNQPLANVRLNLENTAKPVTTDKKGNFNFSADDTLVNATIATGSYANTKVQLRANTTNNINLGTIQMKQDSAFERTVAVVTLGAKTERASNTAVNNPIGGWQSFQDYVSRQLGITDSTTNDDNFSNNAEVVFVTDSNGVAREIKVMNVSDSLQKQKIIEAIRKGPRWTSTNTTTRLLIRY